MKIDDWNIEFSKGEGNKVEITARATLGPLELATFLGVLGDQVGNLVPTANRASDILESILGVWK